MAPPHHQRHFSRSARLRCPAIFRTAREAPAQSARVSFAQNHAAQRTGPLGPRRAARSQHTALQTEWSHALALQLLNRYGIVTVKPWRRKTFPAVSAPSTTCLKALEDSGRVRRGYFVAGLGAAQFALPSAVDLLRSLRNSAQPEKPEIVALAATDPANVYGAVLRWPQRHPLQIPDEPDSADGATRSLTRSVGASVILRNGELIAYMRRNNPNLQVFLPADEPDRSNAARDLAVFLAKSAQETMRQDESRPSRRSARLRRSTDAPIHEHWLARFLLDAGFQAAPMGFNVRRVLPSVSAAKELQ